MDMLPISLGASEAPLQVVDHSSVLGITQYLSGTLPDLPPSPGALGTRL